MPDDETRRIIQVVFRHQFDASLMPLILSDEILEKAGMSADEARVEIACRLFDAGKLALWPAAQLAQMSRVEFEDELMRRKIPIYRPTVDDLRAEVETLEQLRSKR